MVPSSSPSPPSGGVVVEPASLVYQQFLYRAWQQQQAKQPNINIPPPFALGHNNKEYSMPLPPVPPAAAASRSSGGLAHRGRAARITPAAHEEKDDSASRPASSSSISSRSARRKVPLSSSLGSDLFRFDTGGNDNGGSVGAASLNPPATFQPRSIEEELATQTQYETYTPAAPRTQPPPSGAAKYGTPLERERERLRKALQRYHRAQEKAAARNGIRPHTLATNSAAQSARAISSAFAPRPSTSVGVPRANGAGRSSSRPATARLVAPRPSTASAPSDTHPALFAPPTGYVSKPFVSSSSSHPPPHHGVVGEVPFWLPLSKREGSTLMDEVLDSGSAQLHGTTKNGQDISIEIHKSVERDARTMHIPEEELIRRRQAELDLDNQAALFAPSTTMPHTSMFLPPPVEYVLTDAAHPTAYGPYLGAEIRKEERNAAAASAAAQQQTNEMQQPVYHYYGPDGAMLSSTVHPWIQQQQQQQQPVVPFPPSTSSFDPPLMYPLPPLPPPPAPLDVGVQDPSLPNLLGWVLTLHPERLALRSAADRWRQTSRDREDRRRRKHAARNSHTAAHELIQEVRERRRLEKLKEKGDDTIEDETAPTPAPEDANATPAYHGSSPSVTPAAAAAALSSRRANATPDLSSSVSSASPASAGGVIDSAGHHRKVSSFSLTTGNGSLSVGSSSSTLDHISRPSSIHSAVPTNDVTSGVPMGIRRPPSLHIHSHHHHHHHQSGSIDISNLPKWKQVVLTEEARQREAAAAAAAKSHSSEWNMTDLSYEEPTSASSRINRDNGGSIVGVSSSSSSTRPHDSLSDHLDFPPAYPIVKLSSDELNRIPRPNWKELSSSAGAGGGGGRDVDSPTAFDRDLGRFLSSPELNEAITPTYEEYDKDRIILTEQKKVLKRSDSKSSSPIRTALSDDPSTLSVTADGGTAAAPSEDVKDSDSIGMLIPTLLALTRRTSVTFAAEQPLPPSPPNEPEASHDGDIRPNTNRSKSVVSSSSSPHDDDSAASHKRIHSSDASSSTAGAESKRHTLPRGSFELTSNEIPLPDSPITGQEVDANHLHEGPVDTSSPAEVAAGSDRPSSAAHQLPPSIALHGIVDSSSPPVNHSPSRVSHASRPSSRVSHASASPVLLIATSSQQQREHEGNEQPNSMNTMYLATLEERKILNDANDGNGGDVTSDSNTHTFEQEETNRLITTPVASNHDQVSDTDNTHQIEPSNVTVNAAVAVAVDGDTESTPVVVSNVDASSSIGTASIRRLTIRTGASNASEPPMLVAVTEVKPNTETTLVPASSAEDQNGTTSTDIEGTNEQINNNKTEANSQPSE